MKRIAITPRPGWEKIISSQGFLFYKEDTYYNETAAYEFTHDEIALIEKATNDIYTMCLGVVDHVITHKLWDEFLIPREYADWIEWSWRTQQPSFYGRFDLGFNNGNIRLFEFNADTPTLLLESSVIQWYWLQDYNKDLDQFNSIHDRLLIRLRQMKQELFPGKLHFTCADNMEDFMNLKYLQDVAAQAGLDTEFLYIDAIGLDNQNRFTNASGEPVTNIFKLYPYEWMFSEPFGEFLTTNRDNCKWIEPPYKAILSNKMLLKYLHDLYPDSPYVLPCTLAGDTLPHNGSFVKKPIFSREGENVSIIIDGRPLEETPGEYGEEGYIQQQYFELPEFQGRHPIIGSWVIGGIPAGIGIRESSGRITNTYSSFCPHYIAP